MPRPMTFPSPLRLSSELLVTLDEPERNKDRVSLQHVRLAMLVGWEGDVLRYCRARPHRRVAGHHVGPQGLARARPAQVRRERPGREPPHGAPRDPRLQVVGHRDLPRPVDGEAAGVRGRVLVEVLAPRVRRHHGPGRRLLPGVLPPRPAARGGLRPTATDHADPGASRAWEEARHPATMKHVGEHFAIYSVHQ